MLTDTHCHLNFDKFDHDRSAIIERAIQTGIGRILNPGIDLITSRAAIALAEQHDTIYAAVGIHPNSPGTLTLATLDALRQMARHVKVVAIGEIGLDYYRDHTPHDVQADTFRQQLDLAAELNLPVIIHCRDAHSDTRAIIRAWQAETENTPPGVFHSFGGTLADAQATLALGFYIGITGPVTYPKADELRQIAATVPLDKLLIETDAPFLAPQQRRGKRNEPGYVRWVAERIAQERQIELETIITQTAANAQALFGWENTRTS